jgi:hypothetical protein
MGRPIIALRRFAMEGFMGALPMVRPPRAGIDEGIEEGISADMGEPIIPPSAFFTEPPFLSFSSTVGSVVIILTIGLN